MSPLLLILASLALHLIGFALLFRAARRSRRHRPLPVIGRDPILTERLHLRLNLNRSGCALVEVTVGIAFMIGFALLMIALMSDGPAN
jgi:hypothetical protein